MHRKTKPRLRRDRPTPGRGRSVKHADSLASSLFAGISRVRGHRQLARP